MKTKRSKSTRKACAAQHFGVWCVDRAWHTSTFAAVKSGLLKPLVENVDRIPLTYDNVGGVAVIPVEGMLLKGVSSFGGTSMLELTAVIRDADADPAITSILLEIDSPGGTYAGIEAVSTALGRVTKPTTAKVSDWAASGALWVASYCDEIILNRTGQVGSIGAFTVLCDTSKADEMDGFNYILIDSGGLKGAGEDGRITPEFAAAVQKDIDRCAADFIATIAKNREMSVESVKAIADGRMFTADEALNLGLIDRVIDEVDAETFLNQENAMTREEFIAHASAHPEDLKEAAKAVIQDEVKQALIASKPAPASIEELETAFPGDEKFVVTQAKAKATVDQAKIAYAEKARADLKAANDQIAQLKEDMAKIDPAMAGRAPVDVPAPKDETKTVAETSAAIASKAMSGRYGHHAAKKK